MAVITLETVIYIYILICEIKTKKKKYNKTRVLVHNNVSCYKSY